ncbi:hypothetical protein KM043_004568 [Ampulex compressa]|nr:hypothetical protein KM043_004568 [Ampulex compressa]
MRSFLVERHPVVGRRCARRLQLPRVNIRADVQLARKFLPDVAAGARSNHFCLYLDFALRTRPGPVSTELTTEFTSAKIGSMLIRDRAGICPEYYHLAAIDPEIRREYCTGYLIGGNSPEHPLHCAPRLQREQCRWAGFKNLDVIRLASWYQGVKWPVSSKKFSSIGIRRVQIAREGKEGHPVYRISGFTG